MDLKTIKGVKRLGFLAIFLIVAVGVMLVAYPLFTQSQKFADEIAISETDQNGVLENLNKSKGYQATIGDVEKIDSDLSTEFPTSANTPQLVNFVAGAASDAGMRVSDIDTFTTGIPTLVASTVAAAPAAAAPVEGEAPAADAEATPADPAAAPVPGATGGDSNLAEMTISLTATASIDELGNFLENLQNGERNLLISGYSITTDPGTGASTLKVDGKTFIYKAIPTVSEQAESVAVPEVPATGAPATTPVPETPAG